MMLIIYLSRMLKRFRMLSLGPTFKIRNVRVIDKYGGDVERLEDDVSFVAQD